MNIPIVPTDNASLLAITRRVRHDPPTFIARHESLILAISTLAFDSYLPSFKTMVNYLNDTRHSSIIDWIMDIDYSDIATMASCAVVDKAITLADTILAEVLRRQFLGLPSAKLFLGNNVVYRIKMQDQPHIEICADIYIHDDRCTGTIYYMDSNFGIEQVVSGGICGT